MRVIAELCGDFRAIWIDFGGCAVSTISHAAAQAEFSHRIEDYTLSDNR
ncbi:Uncharacterised protein [Vibrio cholerae]|uniref:Uncharacterized protein n=1 Tax=Vibrio cholerae TaxID=666 RepID=A0A655YKN0_VIBCL|nr:Uncharacterised protein [Vibrio cholerae]